MRRVMIVGATSAIAEQSARAWLREPADLLLVGRDAAKLQRLAADLQVRSPRSSIATATLDFLDPVAIGELVAEFAAGGAIDLALVAHGTLPAQGDCQANLAGCRDAMLVNAVSPALFLEALAGAMAAHDTGRLVILGSVAGDRGRRSNYIYGASKALLDRYAQGLQHRFAGTGPRVSLVKPGPTRTPMTAGMLDSGLPLAPVEQVAAAIVKGVEKGKPVIYAPGRWALIMLVIRHLPRFVFNRLDI